MENSFILHMDLDTFFVSVERLRDSQLNNKPILIGGSSDRGVVAACSYEARKFGIHSAMPMKLAMQLCPEAIVIKGSHTDYTKFSMDVSEIIRENVPVFEKTSIDEFYADLTGMDRFFGCFKLASELRDKVIDNTGLPISFGLSINKTVSKVATGEAKPNNKIWIKSGTEKPFLAPLSVQKIPMIGEKTYQTLRGLGVRKVRTLQEMPKDMLVQIFGKNGAAMWEKANGIDHSPVIPYSERKSISTEQTFNKDTTDITRLKNIILAMTEHLAYQLRNENKLTACVAVKIRYSDFNTYTQQARISYTSADHILIPKVTELFEKLYDRRLLVRLVGVRFSSLVHGNYQINLFEDTGEIINLYQEMDWIKKKYGDRSLVRAKALGVNALRTFNPFKGDMRVAKVET
ncbi:DNA polymerase-4 [Ekhidna lutea]|uniref:DNA polymerase IV n=1 Tax=Ekhidna lutea TaxID=447679 RepID=A0A239MC64_EKHLU|nr:DNA polymerase IV [Ekhidna lutea]SNT40070.1 DNA polymerase-4 [Ekhidna lutea]